MAEQRTQEGGAVPEQAPEMMVEELGYRPLRGVMLAIFNALTIVSVLLVLNQLFNLHLFVGIVFIDVKYLYLLAALILPLTFLAYPLRKGGEKYGLPIHDIALAAVTFGLGVWFAWTSDRALAEGWEYAAPTIAITLSAIYWLLIIEALRRTGGNVIAVIVFAVSLYPWYAAYVPGPISGHPASLTDTFAYHVLSAEAAFGIPMRAFGELVVGFIIFGVALNYTGGGKFFNDAAFAMVGGLRGGAAQVGVISSMLQGSISGSVISNVISSGVVTIPAMKRTGFSPAYAGGVEAVASTGGVLMPPVMGSTAFVMAAFLQIPYAEIAAAAAIPALLFYFGLMVQIDAYSARRKLVGLTRAERPRMGQVMREGWVYIIVFAVLVYFMLNESQEAIAPFYATAVLLVINQIMPQHRMSWAKFRDFVAATGRSLTELVAILMGVGFIIGALMVTGLAGTLANDLVFIAGDAPLVLLLMGALTSFIFGMGMTVTACYIFLAIVLAPALIKAGLDPLAVHLFIMYWGMVSFITPPVAIGAFAAATIARANPFSVGFEAVRLGTVIYLVPFFFVLNPALILRGPLDEIIIVTATAFIGVWLLGSALQGYLLGVGVIRYTLVGWIARAALFLAGLAFGLPGGERTGFTHWELTVSGIVLGALAIVLIKLSNRSAPGLEPSLARSGEPIPE